MPRECCKRFFARIMQMYPDVPVFTLVGYDKAAKAAIEAWLKKAEALGANQFKLDVAKAHLADFKRYEQEHPEAMKVPD